MSLKYGKAEIGAVAAVLDGEYESAEEAAEAALDAMEEIFEKRAKFVVVGQLARTQEHGDLQPGQIEAIKLSLGWYSTQGDADKAAESLWKGNATGDEFRVWVLPVFHGTPSDLHGKRKAQYAEAEAKRKDAFKAKIQDQIRKQQEAAAIRAAGGKGACECTHQQYDHSMIGTSRGKCWVKECRCEKWTEKKR